MSSFRVEVLPLAGVEPHPNADRLDLAVVGDYRVVVAKDALKPGDLVAYIPEASLLPDALIDELGIRQYLAGRDKNRVKAAKLRGVLSEGLVYRARDGWETGQDVAEELGIVKWEPEPVFIHHGKQVDYSEICEPAPSWWQSYDLEALKRYPEAFTDGDEVSVTEKIHGTQGVFGVGPVAEDGASRPFYVSSKGLSQKRWTLRRDTTTVYWQAAEQYDLYGKLAHAILPDATVQIFAEIYGTTPSGKGIQDLTYDATQGLRLAVFDIAINGRFLDYGVLKFWCAVFKLPMVPILYQGPFERGITPILADGRETISGTAGGAHLREGVVIRSAQERWDPRWGRTVLKVVSGAYLTRKEGTEYN